MIFQLPTLIEFHIQSWLIMDNLLEIIKLVRISGRKHNDDCLFCQVLISKTKQIIQGHLSQHLAHLGTLKFTLHPSVLEVQKWVIFSQITIAWRNGEIVWPSGLIMSAIVPMVLKYFVFSFSWSWSYTFPIPGIEHPCHSTK